MTTQIIEQLGDLAGRVGITGVEGEAREELNNGIAARLQEVIIDTVLANLTDDQFEEFKKAVDEGGEVMEQKIIEITAQIPSLKELMEENIELELGALKELYSAATK